MVKPLAIVLLLVSPIFAVRPTDWPYSTVCDIQAGAAGGSGTLIGIAGDKGLVATAAHVIEGHKTITVRFPDGYASTGLVLAADERLDLAAAIIYVKPGMCTPRGLRAAGASDNVVVACGYPYYGRETPHWTQGRVLQLRGDQILFAAKPYIHSGFSGGALFGRDGCYLGSTNGYGEWYSYAAGGPAMVRFYSRWLRVGP